MQTKNIYKLYDYVEQQQLQLLKQTEEINTLKQGMDLQNVKINSLF